MNDLIKKLLHIEDTPLKDRPGLFHRHLPRLFALLRSLYPRGLAIAFLFGLNWVAILLGVWTNTPWWIVLFYAMATWIGMWVTGFQVDWATFREVFQLGTDQGFMSSNFRECLISQWGLLLSFLTGSLILCTLLGVVAYPLSEMDQIL